MTDYPYEINKIALIYIPEGCCSHIGVTGSSHPFLTDTIIPPHTIQFLTSTLEKALAETIARLVSYSVRRDRGMLKINSIWC